MTGSTAADQPVGDLLQDFVDQISHRGGRTLAVMTEGSVTLQQVLLLNRLFASDAATATELAAQLHMSLSSVSQMIDRLDQLGLVARIAVPEDRRKKAIELTRKGHALLHRVREARSAEYRAGVARLSLKLRADLARVLARALRELAAAERASSPAAPAV
ncbi:MAG TPA: MarR family transcriptional regulator [Stellaceae bacterium]|nr:MarR family transcriptional regulator [Stellaceae bacterium]